MQTAQAATIGTPVLLGYLLPALAARRESGPKAALPSGHGPMVLGLAAVTALTAVAAFLGGTEGAPDPAERAGRAFVAAVYGVGIGLWPLGAYAVARRLRAGPLAAQVAAGILWTAMLGTVYYGNPIVEAAPDPAARHAWMTFLIGVNPPCMLAYHALGVDLLHRPLLYLSISVIPDFGGYRYPSWISSLGIPWGAVILLRAGTGALRWKGPGAR